MKCAQGGWLLLPLFLMTGAVPKPAAGHFRLALPDFTETSFDSGVIDLPDRTIRRLNILVLQAFERNILASSVRVLVNGKGIGNILETRTVAEGMLLMMDPV